jgi:hypothetical protein
MAKKYDIKFAAREYEVKGEKKTYWSSHGTLFIEDSGKIKIKMDSRPDSKDYDGWFQVFEQKPKEQYQGLPRDDGDDIPF